MWPPFELIERDSNRNLLISKSRDGCSNYVESLLKAGTDINAKDRKGRTSLHWACWNKRNRVVDLLLSHGADYNIQDHYGKTSLHYACISGHPKTVSMILKAGVHVNQVDSQGHNALFYATGYPVVQQLVLKGAALTQVNLTDWRVIRALKSKKQLEETMAMLKEIKFLTPTIIDFELAPFLYP